MTFDGTYLVVLSLRTRHHSRSLEPIFQNLGQQSSVLTHLIIYRYFNLGRTLGAYSDFLKPMKLLFLFNFSTTTRFQISPKYFLS